MDKNFKIKNIQHTEGAMYFEYRGKGYYMTCAEIIVPNHYTKWFYYIHKEDSNNAFWVTSRHCFVGYENSKISYFNDPKLTEQEMEEIANDYMVNRKNYK